MMAAQKKAAPKKTGPRNLARRKKIRLPKKTAQKTRIKTRTAARKSQNPRSLKPRNLKTEDCFGLFLDTTKEPQTSTIHVTRLLAAQFYCVICCGACPPALPQSARST